MTRKAGIERQAFHWLGLYTQVKVNLKLDPLTLSCV